MNGLRRAPLLWLLELQRQMSLGGQETFEPTLFPLPSSSNGVVLVLVYVDDLLIASSSAEEGEQFLVSLQKIWRIKRAGHIPPKCKGTLEFLGRTIYRPRDGDLVCILGLVESIWKGSSSHGTRC